MLVSSLKQYIQKGFTLIELTIGIAVLSLALAVMTGAMFPQAERSVDPWVQVRSAELAQSMMNEVLARRFDENSFVQGNLRCGEDTGTQAAPACVTAAVLNDCTLGTGFQFREEGANATKDNFDDVDDFNCYSVTGNAITDITGNQNLVDIYGQFTIHVAVSYLVPNQLKLVTVTVVPPQTRVGTTVDYSAYKANY